MYARVWKFGILPGKTDEFAAVVKSAVPTLRQLAGFRGMLVLRTGPGEMLEATVISTWETLDELRDSENSALQPVLLRTLSCCERHPVMREEEVLLSEFGSADSPDITAID